jgi:recombination DNA repair RAD52 pathway protein
MVFREIISVRVKFKVRVTIRDGHRRQKISFG